jgi:hypothetical protein
MGNGAVMPAAASADTSGAGTPAPAKETACGARAEPECAAPAGLGWWRLAGEADGRSVGRADK